MGERKKPESFKNGKLVKMYSYSLKSMTPQNSYTEILTPKRVVVRSGAFGRRLDH